MSNEYDHSQAKNNAATSNERRKMLIKKMIRNNFDELHKNSKEYSQLFFANESVQKPDNLTNTGSIMNSISANYLSKSKQFHGTTAFKSTANNNALKSSKNNISKDSLTHKKVKKVSYTAGKNRFIFNI